MDGTSSLFMAATPIALYYYFKLQKDKEDRQRKLLARTEYDLSDIDGWNCDPALFEEYLKNCFTIMGYACTLTPKSGDMGGDIIAQKGPRRLCIQAKCYGPGHSVGAGAVMEAYAGAAFYGCEGSIVITNRYFTRSAIKLACRIGVQLWDRDALSSTLIQKMHLTLDYQANGKTFIERYIPDFLRKISGS